MPRFRPMTAGLFAVAVWSLSAPVMAGHAVPIKGTLDSQNTIVAPAPGLPGSSDLFFLNIDGSATGKASHLGAITAQLGFDLGFTFLNPVTPVPDDFAGTITFRAANGDLLYATFDGAYDEPGSLTFTATITFTGGTGRFEDASGSATLEGQDTNASGQFFAAEFEGSIQYKK